MLYNKSGIRKPFPNLIMANGPDDEWPDDAEDEEEEYLLDDTEYGDDPEPKDEDLDLMVEEDVELEDGSGESGKTPDELAAETGGQVIDLVGDVVGGSEDGSGDGIHLEDDGISPFPLTPLSEVAEDLGVSPEELERVCAQREIGFIPPGGTKRSIYDDEIDTLRKEVEARRAREAMGEAGATEVLPPTARVELTSIHPITFDLSFKTSEGDQDVYEWRINIMRRDGQLIYQEVREANYGPHRIRVPGSPGSIEFVIVNVTKGSESLCRWFSESELGGESAQEEVGFGSGSKKKFSIVAGLGSLATGMGAVARGAKKKVADAVSNWTTKKSTGEESPVDPNDSEGNVPESASRQPQAPTGGTPPTSEASPGASPVSPSPHQPHNPHTAGPPQPEVSPILISLGRNAIGQPGSGVFHLEATELYEALYDAQRGHDEPLHWVVRSVESGEQDHRRRNFRDIEVVDLRSRPSSYEFYLANSASRRVSDSREFTVDTENVGDRTAGGSGNIGGNGTQGGEAPEAGGPNAPIPPVPPVPNGPRVPMDRYPLGNSLWPSFLQKEAMHLMYGRYADQFSSLPGGLRRERYRKAHIEDVKTSMGLDANKPDMVEVMNLFNKCVDIAIRFSNRWFEAPRAQRNLPGFVRGPNYVASIESSLNQLRQSAEAAFDKIEDYYVTGGVDRDIEKKELDARLEWLQHLLTHLKSQSVRIPIKRDRGVKEVSDRTPQKNKHSTIPTAPVFKSIAQRSGHVKLLSFFHPEMRKRQEEVRSLLNRIKAFRRTRPEKKPLRKAVEGPRALLGYVPRVVWENVVSVRNALIKLGLGAVILSAGYNKLPSGSGPGSDTAAPPDPNRPQQRQGESESDFQTRKDTESLQEYSEGAKSFKEWLETQE
ncbi:MAG: hypothetical protein ABIA92_02005 [Patescibacteria group bacterium]